MYCLSLVFPKIQGKYNPRSLAHGRKVVGLRSFRYRLRGVATLKLLWPCGARVPPCHSVHRPSRGLDAGGGCRMGYCHRSGGYLGSSLSYSVPTLSRIVKHFVVQLTLADKAMSKGSDHGLCAVFNSQLLQNAMHMGFDRPFREKQRGGNVSIAGGANANCHHFN